MKIKTLTFLAIIWAGNLFAQTLNPRQYAILPRKGLTNFERKDGTYSLPHFNNREGLLFTPNGEYLYLLNAQEKDDGRLVIYNVAKKSVEKIFKMPKLGMYSYQMLVYNPENMYQLAVATGKSEITILPDWRNEPEDALAKKKPENSNRITATGKIEFSRFAFSADGKSLYLQEDKTDQPKVIDLATGKSEKKVMPKGKKLYWNIFCTPFIDNDEALILSQKDKKSSDYTVEIYHMPTAQVTRSYEISEAYGKPDNYTYNPRLLYYSGGMLNLRTGDIDVAPAKIAAEIKKTANNYASVVWPISYKGYLLSQVYYKEEKSRQYITTERAQGLFFLNKNGAKVKPYFPDVNTDVLSSGDFQISPNGKYIVFKYVEKDNEANGKWIIATL